MTTQTEMFPKTELDEATAVLNHLIAEQDKADKASETAEQKAYEASGRSAKQRHVVARLQSMMPAAEAVAEMKRGAEEAGIGVSIKVGDGEEVVVSEPPAVDPITGEVTSIPVANWRCLTCHGDGRLPDKTGYGHHRCKDCHGTGHAEPSCDNCTSSDCNLKQQAGSSTMGCGGSSWLHGEMTSDAEPGGNIYPPLGHDVPAAMGLRPESVVIAFYPGDDEPHETTVGDRTRYSELVADYFTEAGLSAEVDADEWAVVARRELTQDEGGYRSLHDVITPEDYGQELLVVAADQGSVTGTEADDKAEGRDEAECAA